MCVQRAWPSPPACLACNHASQSHGWAGFRTRPEERECTLEAYVVSSHGQRVKTLSLDLDALRQNAVDVPIRDTGHCASCLDSLFDPLDPAYAPSVLPNPCLCLSLSLLISPSLSQCTVPFTFKQKRQMGPLCAVLLHPLATPIWEIWNCG